MSPSPESSSRPPTHAGAWRRLIRTPLMDLLTGQQLAGVDVEAEIAAAGLPQPLPALLENTVRRTKLRRIEQGEICRELIAQFADGLANGRTAAELAAGFGDPRQAARKLRRAKLRGRHVVHRALRRSGQAIAAVLLVLVACYAVLMARYYVGRPTISQQFLTEINRDGRSIDPSDRAWPLYRDAILKMQRSDVQAVLCRESEMRTHWPEVAVYLESQQEVLAIVREAAQRPRLGFVYGDAGDRPWLLKYHSRQQVEIRPDEPLFDVLLPQIQHLAEFSRLLAADARRAAQSGNADALTADVRALIGMAEHLRDTPEFLASELAAFACYASAMRELNQSLADKPELIADGDLVDLSRRLAAFAGGVELRPRLNGEQMLFHDLVQRMYTDDGDGDGRLTPVGIELGRTLSKYATEDIRHEHMAWDGYLVGSGMTSMTAGRRELTELVDGLFDRIATDRKPPMWTWQDSPAQAELDAYTKPTWRNRVRYWPLVLVFPAIEKSAVRGEIVTQQREATLAAIALVRFQRQKQHWPETLAELTPHYLPTPPLDRFTGEPLLYRLFDGKPLLYSTGLDRNDDGGRAHRMGNRFGERWEPPSKVTNKPTLVTDQLGRQMILPPKFDWDWILWPPPQVVLVDSDEAE